GGGSGGSGPGGGGSGAGARAPRAGGGGDAKGGGGGRWAKAYEPTGQKVTTVRFRPGISDDEFTEVLAGGLKEGDEVVIEASGGTQGAAAPASQGAGQRGRGPRMF
ncbi:MAG TPA: hypothetical protein VMT47_01395, partial [Polyangia bacterium]|nr:hypothetical protein [Polyangia bacterium]